MRKILFSLLALAGLVFFPSCDNFLRGGDISKEIKESIAYNNAAACTIVLKADQEKGEFLTGTQITAREGFEAQFQFSLNQDDYIFEEFQALCNTDSSISRADYVEFTEIKNDNKGVYKVTIKLLKKADDIVIRPKCIALPKIMEITPKSESGTCDQDTPIKITFNKPVNPDSFFDDSVAAENRTIKSLKDISIYSEEEDLLEHFATPYFSSDNKILYIPVDQNKLILPPDQTRSFLNIKFAYNFANAKDSEGYSIKQNGLHEYKINKNFGNQKKVMVNIHSDEKYGTLLTASEKECTVGYTIEIQYKPNLEDYKFTGFKAVSVKNDTVSRASAVSFENTLLDEETGIYSVRVRVVEGADDLLLLPACYEYPKILSYSPDSSHENYANMPIQVNFSIPMEAADTTAENSVFNYENILLTANGKSAAQYFDTPVFDSQKKVLTLPLKGRLLADYLNDSPLTTLLINVTFTERILITKNEVSVGLKDNGKTSFSVLYNKLVETVPPECLAFEITSQKITLQNASEILNGKRKVILPNKTTLAATEETLIDNKFTDKNVATGEGIPPADYEKTVWQNLTNGTVYIYGSYSDTGSGVKTVCITEQFTHYSDGDTSASDPVTTEYTEESENAEFETNNGITKFCIKYKLASKDSYGDSADGAISIKVLVKDACGNSSKQEKRTAINVGRVHFGNVSNGSGRGEKVSSGSEYVMYGQYKFDTEKHNAAIKKVTCEIYDDGCDHDSQIFKDVIFPVNSYSVVCEYIGKNGTNQSVTLEPLITNEDSCTVCDWYHTLDVDSVEGMFVKFVITDVLGNVMESVQKFPRNETKVSFRKRTDGNIASIFTDSSNNEIRASNNALDCVIIGKPKNGTQEYCWSNADFIYLLPDYEYRIYNTQHYDFTGEIQDIVFTKDDYKEITTLQPLSIKNDYIEKGSKDGYVERVVELNDTWKDYDYVYAYHDGGNRKIWDFKDGVFTCTYEAKSCFAPVITQFEEGTPEYVTAYKNNATYLKVYGVKDNIRVFEDEWELSYITEQQKIDFDDVPATISASCWGTNSWNNHNPDSIKFTVEDSLSGPLYGKVSVPDNKNSKVYTTTEAPFEVFLPVWEYMPMSGLSYPVKYELKDKSANGNKKEGYYPGTYLTPIIGINLLKANTDGSYLINLDTLYPNNWLNWNFYVSRLGSADNNVWQTPNEEEDFIKDYFIIDDYIILKESSDTDFRRDVESVKEIYALYGIPAESIGRPVIYAYSFSVPDGYSDVQSYKTALINAGIPEDSIVEYSNSVAINPFTIPANKTLDEFYNILTSSTGNLKVPGSEIEVRLPVINTELIPRSPYKVALSTDKDILSTSYNNCFVKIIADVDTGHEICSNSIYRYIGNPGSGDYDWLMQKSETDNYLLVSSDAPVFVHTLVTQLPYETCKDWSIDEWEYFKENHNDKFFDFSSTDHYPRRYSIPLTDIPAGSCYIVIAHFADNHVETSKVFVKP